MSTWAFKPPQVKFKKEEKVEVTRSFVIPGVGIIHSGRTGVIKDVSASGEPLVEMENKSCFYINPRFLKRKE
ncbi:hypothetical protein DRJ04_04180 [Candidatus Aerophobetes bacterium]|uniref:Uncharacterized protein n=1 Tax=Aerophobetes bacterium TaxID=2030807 RepID=A0A662DF71_UNCAE|nr:MAG: hypothetical protein DRJ04_04180 [Candidatus Aerophobetes bacterium]